MRFTKVKKTNPIILTQVPNYALMNASHIHLEPLQTAVNDFIAFYQEELNYHTMVYTLWDAKDILGHIVFWHESFAANIADLGHGCKPNPLKGKLSEVNARSVETTKEVPIPELIERLRQAQHTIEQHIYNESIDLIPYKKGSRDYSRSEHVDIVTHHIGRHLRDVRKKLTPH